LKHAAFAACVIFLQACSRGTLPESPLKMEMLPVTSYEIQTGRDTTVQTPGGASLQIPAGSLEAKTGSSGRLLIREAYTVGQMLRGGLSTLSGSDILSAGGLISIEADSSTGSKLKKPLTLALPAATQTAGMQVWRDTGRYHTHMSWQLAFAQAPAATVQVPALGWVGTGTLIKDLPGFENYQLLAEFSGAEKEGISVYLILPEEKIVLEGGPAIAGAGSYAFYRNDGTTPLRPGGKGIVIGIKENKGGYLFAMKPFTAKPSQNIQMELQPTTKEALLQTLEGIGK